MDFVNNSVYLRKEMVEDLALNIELINCEETMSYIIENDCQVSFSFEQQKGFLDELINVKGERETFLIYNLDNVFVGIINVNYCAYGKNVSLSIIIKYEYRQNHHATDALDLFLDYIFSKNRVECVMINISKDNIVAYSFFQGFGFVETEKTAKTMILKLKGIDWL